MVPLGSRYRVLQKTLYPKISLAFFWYAWYEFVIIGHLSFSKNSPILEETLFWYVIMSLPPSLPTQFLPLSLPPSKSSLLHPYHPNLKGHNNVSKNIIFPELDYFYILGYWEMTNNSKFLSRIPKES